MDFEITPEPDEQTRQAILEALAAEDAAQPPSSPWAEQELPRRGDDELSTP
ncbi:MAG TPA: hypothetical protein VFJ91_04900 [Gaiellaceae bacterium]|nr:hypothetical protein [Gaiellaceae bacterium]